MQPFTTWIWESVQPFTTWIWDRVQPLTTWIWESLRLLLVLMAILKVGWKSEDLGGSVSVSVRGRCGRWWVSLLETSVVQLVLKSVM